MRCPPHLYFAHLTLSDLPSPPHTLSAPQIGPLVRLLVVVSDRLNRLFGLSKPLTAEEESEPPESVGQQAVRWLRRRHYRWEGELGGGKERGGGEPHVAHITTRLRERSGTRVSC